MALVSSTRGVSFLPKHPGQGFEAHAKRVAKETEKSYQEHTTGQERYRRAHRKEVR